MKTLTNRQRANRVVKFTGLFFILLGGLNHMMIPKFSWDMTAVLIAVGLFMLLFAPERIDDERVKQSKLQAVTWACASGLLGVQLYTLMVTSLPGKDLPVLSAYDGFIILFALAIAIYHGLRWRDGRAA